MTPAEPTALVVFELKDAADGVRRAKAFTANERGWSMQVQLFEKYLRHAE